MTALKVIGFLLGAVAVAWTLLSAVTTVILPRSSVSLLSRSVFRGTNVLFRFLAAERRSFENRDRVMALYAPVSLLLHPVAWLALVSTGYMVMFWAAGDRSWAESFHLSGSSLLTLGFANVDTLPDRLLAFSEATLGLGLVALLITFLPSMYGAFSRREALVGLLEVRAGSPPSAAEFLERYYRIQWLDRLPETWRQWEVWFGDVEESHTSYGALAFFRSPQPDRSWVIAAGTVLDAAALTVSLLDVPRQPDAHLCIRGGYLTLRRIAGFFGVRYDPDPRPDDPISISREEFDQVCERLTAAGVPLRADRDQAWRDFAGWRVNYDTVLLSLAELTMAPYAPWTSDRSPPSHTPPKVARWGLRARRREPGAPLSSR